jgi:hypothetical protein
VTKNPGMVTRSMLVSPSWGSRPQDLAFPTAGVERGPGSPGDFHQHREKGGTDEQGKPAAENHQPHDYHRRDHWLTT